MQTNKESWGIVFPGQGSQSVGMLADIAPHYSIVAETFLAASSVLQYDVWDMVQNGPKETLDQTRFTQPALLTASYALYRIIAEKCAALNIKTVAGHSLGEYTALLAAGALDFQTAALLVAARGHYMQEAVPNDLGAMAAIVGLSDDAVSALCEEVRLKESPDIGVLAPANFNSVGQVVIAGHRTLVLSALSLAKEQGAKLATLLPVSVPSHCPLMHPAADRLQNDLAAISFQTPQLAVISNAAVMPYTDAASIVDGLTKQLYSPVRWVETIQSFSRLGITHVIECGPQKVLSGLIKRIDKTITVYSIGDAAGLTTFLEA